MVLSMTISNQRMIQEAEKAILNAPNSDWQNRGCEMVGESQQIPVVKQNYLANKEQPLGDATVAYFKFLKPQKDTSPMDKGHEFVGFTISVMDIQGKTIHETHPVIGKLDEEDFQKPAERLSGRFCPQCYKVDSVKQRSRRGGPECIYITYYCKCGYKDTDVFD